MCWGVFKSGRREHCSLPLKLASNSSHVSTHFYHSDILDRNVWNTSQLVSLQHFAFNEWCCRHNKLKILNFAAWHLYLLQIWHMLSKFHPVPQEESSSTKWCHMTFIRNPKRCWDLDIPVSTTRYILHAVSNESHILQKPTKRKRYSLLSWDPSWCRCVSHWQESQIQNEPHNVGLGSSWPKYMIEMWSYWC